ncbi:hypothetical protein LARI1_G008652 [Lachnellula arida]|uniref:Peptidase A1 domain-containing protein n=1 Tax=Lachnellula arida TaxID=1316785 RepID=A0A8T9B0S5_9HELO|nr:hypothetical protein LARI1_G008652 [Lachnellula arida]
MLSWGALAAFMVLQLLGLPRGLEAAATPLVVPPSQSWDGNDGPWSSFSLRVGTPPQNVRVMVSTASNQPLVVLLEGCNTTDPSNCPNSRGALFQINGSSSYYVPSWSETCIVQFWMKHLTIDSSERVRRTMREMESFSKGEVYGSIHNNSTEGIFSLGIDTNLGYSGNGVYGYDNVSLGDSLPALDDQIVGGITTKDFFLGLLGVNPAATNFPYMTSPVPSYLSSLKAQNLIPSLSYAYTAGNQYRFNKALGSLTLGGYDASLFVPNELTVALGSTSDLTINVNKITMSSKNENKTLGSTSFSASIDSTVPYLYLPDEVCQQFEDAFGIVYDTASGLYLVNDTLHTQLLSEAADITFTLTDEKSKVLVDIVLPYQAFDLVAQWPLVQNDTRYFPLKRAADNSQTTLGRAFLQEALVHILLSLYMVLMRVRYLIADYERSNFSISQRKWDANAKANVQPILLSSDTPATHKKTNVGLYVGITIGIAALVTFLVAGFIILRKKYKKTRAIRTELQLMPAHSPKPSLPRSSLPSFSLSSVSGPVKRDDIQYQPVMVSPSLTNFSGSELDAVSTELQSPETGGKKDYFQSFPERSISARSTNTLSVVHELPARELGKAGNGYEDAERLFDDNEDSKLSGAPLTTERRNQECCDSAGAKRCFGRGGSSKFPSDGHPVDRGYSRLLEISQTGNESDTRTSLRRERDYRTPTPPEDSRTRTRTSEENIRFSRLTKPSRSTTKSFGISTYIPYIRNLYF